MHRYPGLRHLALAAVTLVVCVGGADAGESQIELRDGSQVRAELISVDGGYYLLRSATLGEVRVRETDVVSIRPLASGGYPAFAPGPANAGEVAAIQQQLLGNAGLLQLVETLQGDPEIQAALSDPDFMRSVLAGDYQSIRADPRLQSLMAHPLIQSILAQMGGR